MNQNAYSALTDQPEIEYLILHHFGRVWEAFQTLELFHLLLCLDVAALAQQDILFWNLGGSAWQVVLKGGHHTFAWRAHRKDETLLIRLLMNNLCHFGKHAYSLSGRVRVTVRSMVLQQQLQEVDGPSQEILTPDKCLIIISIRQTKYNI